MSNKPVSVIIPAFNEELCVRAILSALVPMKQSRLIEEIILVNDGSRDRTEEKARAFRPQVTIINLPRNTGKGNALAEGIEHASGEIILLLDADLKNLKFEHVAALIQPLQTGNFHISIAQINSYAPFIKTSKVISGQRAYFREDLMPLLGQFSKHRYGIDSWLYHTLAHLPIKIIDLEDIKYVNKIQKHGVFEGIKSHIIMWPQIIKSLIPASLGRAEREIVTALSRK